MATSFKNGLGRYQTGHYYYCFRINGRQFKGSTDTKDLSLAKRVLALKKEEARAAIDREAARLGLDPAEVTPGSLRETPTVSELVKEWMRANKATMSRSHVVSVEGVTRKWILGGIGDVPIDRVGTNEVIRLRNKVLDSGKSPATANHVLRVVKLLWNFAVGVGYLKVLPFKVKQLRLQKRPRAVIPSTKVREFLEAVDARVRNPQVRIILRVMLGLGLRQSEALGMKWEWLSEETRSYQVGKAKGREARVIPVPEWLWTAIHSLPRGESPWVFPADDGAQRRPQFARMPLKRVCSRLGLGNVTQHRLRATFATMHAQAGTPLSEIQGMLGHKNVATTMIYVEQSLEAKRHAQDALSQKLGLA